MHASKRGHYTDVIMRLLTSQIISLAIVYSTVYSGADQRKHQSSASLAFVRGIHRGPVNSPHKGTVMRKIFPFDDVIMAWGNRMFVRYWWSRFKCFVWTHYFSSPRADGISNSNIEKAKVCANLNGYTLRLTRTERILCIFGHTRACYD